MNFTKILKYTFITMFLFTCSQELNAYEMQTTKIRDNNSQNYANYQKIRKSYFDATEKFEEPRQLNELKAEMKSLITNHNNCFERATSETLKLANIIILNPKLTNNQKKLIDILEKKVSILQKKSDNLLKFIFSIKPTIDYNLSSPTNKFARQASRLVVHAYLLLEIIKTLKNPIKSNWEKLQKMTSKSNIWNITPERAQQFFDNLPDVKDIIFKMQKDLNNLKKIVIKKASENYI
ncbi:hypothetical protein K9L05_04290 [Candidatus Babeliales bacterium]|nr:hypothetical protein [Candidatus Babeliales bacterium]MCF7899832.1 hypothetical protein [Candidatus Babeliales bacterium]